MMMASYLISDKVSCQKERNMIGTYALKIISFYMYDDDGDDGTIFEQVVRSREIFCALKESG